MMQLASFGGSLEVHDYFAIRTLSGFHVLDKCIINKCNMHKCKCIISSTRCCEGQDQFWASLLVDPHFSSTFLFLFPFKNI